MRLTVMSGNIANQIREFSTNDDDAIAVFQIAADDQFGNTSFIPCKAFGNTAEFILDNFEEGDGIQFTGNIRRDSWQDGNDEWQERVYTTVSNVEFPPSSGQPDADEILDEVEEEPLSEEDLPSI